MLFDQGKVKGRLAYPRQQRVSLHVRLYVFRKYISSVHSSGPLFVRVSAHVADRQQFPILSAQRSFRTDLSSLPGRIPEKQMMLI